MPHPTANTIAIDTTAVVDDADHLPGGTASTRGRVTPLVALAAALTPIVVAAIRYIVQGAVARGDAGYFVARSRDVLTSHHPFIGAYSSGSDPAGENRVNSLGPLQLDLLAPFTKIDPYWGTVVGTALLSVCSVVGVWLIARRMFGPAGVAGAMLATLVVEMGIGTEMMVDTRQQAALILPFWCLLWLSAGFAAGRPMALPAMTFLASLTVQTHLSYVVITGVVVVASIAIAIVDDRSQLVTRYTKPVVWSIAVAVVCWAQPLWDQFAGTGNISALADGGGEPGIGVARGARVVAESVLLPPFGLGGRLDSFLRFSVLGEPEIGAVVAEVAIGVWSIALVAACVVARRASRHEHAALAAVGVAALVGALAGASTLPPSPLFGTTPQNYYWMWAVGAFAATGIVAGLSRLLRSVPDRLPLGLVGLALVVAVALLRPTDYWHDQVVDEEAARALLDQVDGSLADAGIDGPVVLDFLAGVGADELAFILLAELQAANVEFRFPADTANIARFGEERCMDGSEQWELQSVIDADPRIGPGDTILAEVDMVPEADVAELAELDREMGDALRAGDVVVEVDGARFVGFAVPATFEPVLLSSQRPATGLAASLGLIEKFDFVAVDESVRDDFDRWVELARLNRGRTLALVARPVRAEFATC